MSNQTNEYLVKCVDKPEYLLNVLKQKKFVCRYSIEEFKGYLVNGESKKFGVPMVCFCDVGDSFLEEHAKTYGQYMIFMKKEWGVKKQLLPIHYIHDNLGNSDNHITSLKQLYEYIIEGNNNYILEDVLIRLLAYTKPYKKEKSNKLYYDEREWRFIPKNFGSKFLLELNDKTCFNDENGDSKINEDEQKKLNSFSDYYLEFEYSNIQKVVILDSNIETNEELRLFCNDNNIQIDILYSKKKCYTP